MLFGVLDLAAVSVSVSMDGFYEEDMLHALFGIVLLMTGYAQTHDVKRKWESQGNVQLGQIPHMNGEYVLVRV